MRPSTLSVAWDGGLHDCNFSQMLDLCVAGPMRHIGNFATTVLGQRASTMNQHGNACTAGSGSSCGGATA